ncbi:hypothetical protein BP6252_09093 [Coleophoma cylindrospora]|uniref:DNA 3'-5' helicase n=1 Tax=Coleophoma cylindrospora TaxID=1849047 RepID=A0A3D8R0Y2_9HELO|nr:hypothetical protein BP6252_09093 [Coleophoma cylindrospora]
MTRHNLQVHISWLLRNKVTPPVGVTANFDPENFDEDFAEDSIDEDIPPPLPSSSDSSRNPRIIGAVAEEEFVRPSLPRTKPSKPLPAELPQRSVVDGSMGRLESTRKSARPGLMSQQQHQLATPASTSGSTAKSLHQNYSAFLRGNATPSTNLSSERFPTSTSKPLPTPQTPRQTPRRPSRQPSELKTQLVESIDLTEDDYTRRPSSRSSSSVEIWGEPTTLWTEDHASRLQPLPKNGKKRKSIEVDVGDSPSKDKSRSPENIKRKRRPPSDDFEDIDELEISETLLASAVKSVPTPACKMGFGNLSEEEYDITETINRVETRIGRSASRDTSDSATDTTRRSRDVQSDMRLNRSQSFLQVSATPNCWPPPVVATTETPQKHLDASRKTRIIQDSEDDEAITFEDFGAPYSPVYAIKNSSQPRSPQKAANWQSMPDCEISRRPSTGLEESTQRPSSPLGPISSNLGQKGQFSTPFKAESPRKLANVLPEIDLISSQQVSSSLPADHELVKTYLKDTLALKPYHQRLRQRLDQNSVESMAYHDNNERTPANLMEERKTMLDMSQAFSSLEIELNKHKTVTEEKRQLARKMFDGLDEDGDAERAAQKARDLRKIEATIGVLLRVSGAVEEGFGSNSHVLANLDSVSSQTNGRDALGLSTADSSVPASNQIILQTQIPALRQSSDIEKSRRVQGFMQSQSPTHTDLLRLSGANSPPSRRDDNAELTSPTRSNKTTARPKPVTAATRQPDRFRGPSPLPYDVDDNYFEDMLEDELEIQSGTARIPGTMAFEEEEDYGGFDDDDDEVLELFERQQQSFDDFSSHRTTLSNPSSKPPKRRSTTSSKDMYAHVDNAHANQWNHPWSGDVKQALKDRFKLSGFRNNQLDAINNTLAGKHTFVLMPTGGGKSLCYQLPAVVQTGKTKGVTIVISPLLSLMSDQVQHLQKLRIQAAFLNGDSEQSQRAELFNVLKGPYPEQYVQLIYITPEMIGKSQAFINALSILHSKQKLARVVIDEAHCVSQWGHDFRPDYVGLREVLVKFPGVPIMALTATATKNVQADVTANLGIEGAKVYAQSFNRPNLNYEVRAKKEIGTSKEILADMCKIIKEKHKNQTGIIYTLSRKGCEDLAATLRKDFGINAHYYHAKMDKEQRLRVQQKWQSGEWKVIVATIAFGMGIDKADVRFVIHHTIPKSLEGYYQETGRAGRDGRPSGCYLYYGYGDTAILQQFIDKSDGDHEQKARQREMLGRMIQFCWNRIECRRTQILAYFGETFTKEECNHTCDNCKSDTQRVEVDFTAEARAAVSLVGHLENAKVTMLHCVKILQGDSKERKIKDLNHNSLKEFGAASKLNRSQIERIFHRLVAENLLYEENLMSNHRPKGKPAFVTKYIKLGSNYRPLMNGQRRLRLHELKSTEPTTKTSTSRKAKAASSKSKKASDATASHISSTYPSTIVTSPVSGPDRRRNRSFNEANFTDAPRINHSYRPDSFIISSDNEVSESDDAFDPPVHGRSSHQRNGTTAQLGPPITTDLRMDALQHDHQVIVHQFVEAAKKLEEKIRNQKNLRRPLFTEAHLRDMAINWTLTPDEMSRISGINTEHAINFGGRFVPLVREYHQNYETLIEDEKQDRDMDANHNIVDPVTEEYGEYDDSFDPEDDMDDSVVEPSKYFSSKPKGPSAAELARFNQVMSIASATPSAQSRAMSPTPARKSYGGGNNSGRGKPSAGRKTRPRKGSGQSSAGVTKRKSFGSGTNNSKKPNMTNSSRSIIAQFANNSGSRRGGSSMSGIQPMPT